VRCIADRVNGMGPLPLLDVSGLLSFSAMKQANLLW